MDMTRKARFSLFSILVLLVLPLCAPAQSASSSSASNNEVRALWVVRTTLTSPEKIQEMVNKASAANFNTLIVQVRGRGDAYYKSRHEPRAIELKDQPAAFDPLATT